MAGLVAARGAVVVLGEHRPVGADEHRAVRLLARLERALGQLDRAAQMFEVDVVHLDRGARSRGRSSAGPDSTRPNSISSPTSRVARPSSKTTSRVSPTSTPTNVSRPSASTNATVPAQRADQALAPRPRVLGAHAHDDAPGAAATSARERRRAPRRSDIAGEPMKPATKRFAGLLVELLGRAHLLEHAVVHDRDPVAHRHRLDLVVGDVDRGRADLLLQPPDLAARLGAQLRVEVRQRLVHQEHLRLAHQRAPQRDALRLAAATAAPAGAAGTARGPAPARPPPPAARSRRAGTLRRRSPNARLSNTVHLRVQRVVLEDHRDVALARRDLVDHAVADRDRARS